MTTPSKSAVLTKLHKVLKKHYKIPVAHSRSVLEHMLFACCLEGAPYEAAEEAFALLQQTYVDWNEVRVTTVSELTEVLTALPDPAKAGARVRNSLYGAFETHFSYDMEFLRKQNLGKSVKTLEGYRKLTPFVLQYMTQHALGGHAIPLNDGALIAMYALGLVTDREFAKGVVPGLERAIPKAKAAEFSALLHQLGVDLESSKTAPRGRTVLAEVDGESKERLAKLAASPPVVRRPPKPPETTPPGMAGAVKKPLVTDKPTKGAKGAKGAVAPAADKSVGAKAPSKESAASDKSTTEKGAGKSSGDKPAPKSASEKVAGKPAGSKGAADKSGDKAKGAKKSAPAPKAAKSPTNKLTKKKPR